MPTLQKCILWKVSCHFFCNINPLIFPKWFCPLNGSFSLSQHACVWTHVCVDRGEVRIGQKWNEAMMLPVSNVLQACVIVGTVKLPNVLKWQIISCFNFMQTACALKDILCRKGAYMEYFKLNSKWKGKLEGKKTVLSNIFKTDQPNGMFISLCHLVANTHNSYCKSSFRKLSIAEWLSINTLQWGNIDHFL